MYLYAYLCVCSYFHMSAYSSVHPCIYLPSVGASVTSVYLTGFFPFIYLGLCPLASADSELSVKHSFTNVMGLLDLQKILYLHRTVHHRGKRARAPNGIRNLHPSARVVEGRDNRSRKCIFIYLFVQVLPPSFQKQTSSFSCAIKLELKVPPYPPETQRHVTWPPLRVSLTDLTSHH